jgi:pimeloyl-ACP methyl ester carboxylesterase
MVGVKEASTIIETAKGPIETLILGNGPAVLILHGALGGYDRARVYSFPEEGFKFILPSRPGYLRTPLSVGTTLKEQVEAVAALLDTLGIEKAAVIGCSAGGLPAIHFAHQYPERCSGLVLGNAINAPLSQWHALMQPIGRLFFRWDWLTWFGVNRAVLFLLQPNLGLQTFGDPAKQKQVKAMLGSIHPTSIRLAGFLNDMTLIQDGDDCPLDQVRVPTLVIHGASDMVVPYQQGLHSASAIPNAQFLSIPHGTHLCFISHWEVIRPTLVQFLRAVSQH